VDPVSREVNELVDKRARHAALNGDVFVRPLPPVDFQGLTRSILLREWQGRSLTPYSRGFLFDPGLRVKGRTGNLFPLYHYVDLSRFRIVEEAMCVCLKDYETMEHDMALQKLRDREASSN
jgi:hypothetical protein